MKKIPYMAALLTALTAGIRVLAENDDPVISDVLEKEKSVFEFHMSLPQFIIIAIFLFCAFMLFYVNFFSYNSSKSGTSRGKHGKKINEKPVIELIKETDPTFDDQKFREFAVRVYEELRSAICNKNLEDVRPFVSDEVIEQIQKNVNYYISRGQTKHYEKNNTYSVRIAKSIIENGMQTITVRVHASFIEYVTSDDKDKIVSGSKGERISRFYKMRFSRVEGLTSEQSYDLVKSTCPSCGAPISVDSHGVCEYCHLDLNEGKYGFVLMSFERWKKSRRSSDDEFSGKTGDARGDN